MRRLLILPAAATASWLLFAQPASACGGLVARNGAVRLERTTTLAAYHGGVERYVTAFQYAANQEDFGSIIPLPGVPTDVRKAGDGTPVLITIPTPNPWVPLHILSLAKGALEPVQADVYLLTDRAPTLLGLDPGVKVQASQAASANLLTDLRSDRDSEWVPDQAWLTFVHIDTAAAKLTHDLAIDASGANVPSPVQAGYNPTGPVPAAQAVGFRPVTTPRIGGSNNHDVAVIALVSVLAGMFLIGVFALTLGFGKRRL